MRAFFALLLAATASAARLNVHGLHSLKADDESEVQEFFDEHLNASDTIKAENEELAETHKELAKPGPPCPGGIVAGHENYNGVKSTCHGNVLYGSGDDGARWGGPLAMSGSFVCNNDMGLGDPAYGYKKSCMCCPTPCPGGIVAGHENYNGVKSTCHGNVLYGSGDDGARWGGPLAMSGSFVCNNDMGLGDPAYGYKKSCMCCPTR